MALPRDAADALARLELFGINFGLERTARLLAELGDPQRGLPAVLVAGTNGKGSVAATVEAIVREAGYRTGLYTSPHLEEVEERLRIGEVLEPAHVRADHVVGLRHTAELRVQRVLRDLAVVELEAHLVELGLRHLRGLVARVRGSRREDRGSFDRGEAPGWGRRGGRSGSEHQGLERANDLGHRGETLCGVLGDHPLEDLIEGRRHIASVCTE